MHTVTMKKKDDMILRIKPGKVRGIWVPKGSVFKDKRRTAKVKARSNFRRELNNG